MLSLEAISAGYGDHLVLRNVSIEIAPSSVVAVLGPNGSGKTTTLRAASGMLKPRQGRLRLDGADVTGATPADLVRQGVCHIPEGRGIFPALTVRENLTVFAERGKERQAIEQAVSAFPVLGERQGQMAGTLSGGQQQMLALARAWIRNPRYVLVDEPTLGLAPIVIDAVYAFLEMMRASGAAMLIVEQYVDRVLALADQVYVVVNGSVAFSGPVASVDRHELATRYMGTEIDV